MNKIWRLRRQGVLLLTLGLGVILGNFNSKIPVALIVILYIAWLLVYDYAMIQNYLPENEEINHVKSRTTKISSTVSK